MISYALAASSAVHPWIQSTKLYGQLSLCAVPFIMMSDNSTLLSDLSKVLFH